MLSVPYSVRYLSPSMANRVRAVSRGYRGKDVAMPVLRTSLASETLVTKVGSSSERYIMTSWVLGLEPSQPHSQGGWQQ